MLLVEICTCLDNRIGEKPSLLIVAVGIDDEKKMREKTRMINFAEEIFREKDARKCTYVQLVTRFELRAAVFHKAIFAQYKVPRGTFVSFLLKNNYLHPLFCNALTHSSHFGTNHKNIFEQIIY
uniref:Copine C-terminal domain-containing protein n=1 Tax=Syphacia muris TaxID=451379 RepID=A0A0N5B0Q5_9BILA